MRIIGGTAGGRLLKVPKGFDVRPTPDLVRQALFNSLGGRVLDARVLELFAGTGALGFECLSRGSRQLVSVEKASRHARILQENFASVGLPAGSLDLRVQDAFAAIKQLVRAGNTFEIILADPPYGDKNVGRRSESFAQKLLDDADVPSLLAPGGVFILGHTKRDTLVFEPHWVEAKTLKHGDSVIRFLHRPEAPAPAVQ